MLQEAGHLGKVKRTRVPEKETAHLTPHYEVQLTFLDRVRYRHLTNGATGGIEKTERCLYAIIVCSSPLIQQAPHILQQIPSL
jgi:hypothetical protein